MDSKYESFGNCSKAKSNGSPSKQKFPTHVTFNKPSPEKSPAKKARLDEHTSGYKANQSGMAFVRQGLSEQRKSLPVFEVRER